MNLIWLLLISCWGSDGQNLILMSPGEQKTISSPSDESITLSKPRIVKVDEYAQHIVIKARKEGEFFLEQKNKTSTIKVLSRNKKTQWEKWIQQVEKIPWLHWNYSHQLDLYGNIHRFEDWKKISTLSKLYNIPYSSYVQVSSDVKKEALKYFKKSHTYFKIKWNEPIEAFIPSFSSPDLFSSFGIQTQKIKWDESPLWLDVQLLVVEDKSNKMKLFKNQSSMNILETPFESLELQLQNFQNKGESQTLFQTQILIENNKTGNFFFGGEVPFHTYQKESLEQNTKWKPYGLSLEIKPKISQNQMIQLNLTANISDIDPTYSTKGSFSTKNHRVQTQVTLKNGQTLLLSGINRKQKGSSSQKPFQFSLPFLISTLTQKGEHREKTKAFIFINAKIQKTVPK